MQISYQVAFDSGFQFVKGTYRFPSYSNIAIDVLCLCFLGGKLPGLRGGVDRGCDGGSNSDTCFSSRFMWRKNGEGEGNLPLSHFFHNCMSEPPTSFHSVCIRTGPAETLRTVQREVQRLRVRHKHQSRLVLLCCWRVRASLSFIRCVVHCSE